MRIQSRHGSTIRLVTTCLVEYSLRYSIDGSMASISLNFNDSASSTYYLLTRCALFLRSPSFRASRKIPLFPVGEDFGELSCTWRYYLLLLEQEYRFTHLKSVG